MALTVSINKNITNKADHKQAGVPGWHNVTLESASELVEIVRNGWAWCGSKIIEPTSGKKPAAVDIDHANFFCLDFDSSNILDFIDAQNHDFFTKYASFIYTTPSHTVENHRFRVVFQLEQPIYNAAEFRQLLEPLIARYGSDVTCKNIDRMWFSNTKALFFSFDNIFPASLVREIINEHVAESSVVNRFNRITVTEDQVREMLSVIPHRDINYLEWMRVISAIGNSFPQVTALSLIESWTNDEQQGLPYRLDHRLERISIGTLIYIAQRFGYDTAKLHSTAPNSRRTHEKMAKADKFKVNYDQMKLYLKELYEFRHDVVKNQLEYRELSNGDFEPFNDVVRNTILSNMRDAGLFISQDIFDQYINSKNTYQYNPFKAYFEAIADQFDDKRDYIREYAALVPTEDSERWGDDFERWTVATVRKLLQIKHNGIPYKNEYILLLTGGQGTGKTTFFEELVPMALRKYYATHPVTFQDKDDKLTLCTNFIINLDEFEGASKSELTDLKYITSQTEFQIRKPYGRFTENMTALASFVANINRSNFLSDETGNRRYLIAEITDGEEISPSRFGFPVDKLWAQAYNYALNNDYNTYLTYEQTEAISRFNKKFETIDIVQEFIETYFEPTNNIFQPDVTFITNLAFYNFVLGNIDRIPNLNSNYLGRVLKRAGFRSKVYKINNKAQRAYACIPTSEYAVAVSKMQITGIVEIANDGDIVL